MTHLDRLSNLISHFEIHAERLPSADNSNLVLTGGEDGLNKLFLYLRACPDVLDQTDAVVHARVDIGGEDNPLFQVLPCKIVVDMKEESDIRIIAELIVKETSAPRCGGGFALDRLCELLVVNLLRHRIEQQSAEPGLFAGLAHPKLSHVIVAMHDSPGRQWQIDDFLQIAGMSRSQFMAEFQTVIGRAPIAYLKHWRMILARIAVLKGDRIKEIAHRYGYGSGDAFCRAFVGEYGVSPTKMVAEIKNSHSVDLSRR